jgi:hypothetical protein
MCINLKPQVGIIYNSWISGGESGDSEADILLAKKGQRSSGGGGGGGGGGEKRLAANRSSLAVLANRNVSKRCRGAAAQGSSTHRRLCSAPRVLARVAAHALDAMTR